MIELKNIEKSFGSHRVLDSIDLTFEKGKISMLLGPSGCGKSTTLRLINQLILPEKGSILIDNKNIMELDRESLRRNMGYAIQGVGLFPHMRVSDNIAVVPKLLKWPKQKIASRIEELLDLVGLPQKYSSKFPHQLSGGEAQRVGVARALAADPDILLMDEPFGALDPINRVRLQQEFLKIQKKLQKTVVFVTHDVGEAVRMADHIVMMQNGQIIAKGDPLSIMNAAENVTTSFLGNSYTLELLGKYTVAMFKEEILSATSHQNTTGKSVETVSLDRLSHHNFELSENATFHDILSHMIINGTSYVDVPIEELAYRIDFDLLIQFLGRKSDEKHI